MDFGKLRISISVMKNQGGFDNEQNRVEDWQLFKTLRAEPITKNSREYTKIQTNSSEIEDVFRVRYLAEMDPKLNPEATKMRVQFKSVQYEIIGIINPEERNRELIITCRAVV